MTPETATCPSCNAILISDEEHELPGVTAVDLAILRGEKKAPGRSRLLSWISGEYPEETGPVAGDSEAFAPPDPAVQREILRLELEAEVANLQAEVNSIESEAAVDRELAGESAASAEVSTVTPATPAAAPADAQTTATPDENETPRRA
ncbi:MAG: hypothetical protein ABI553_01440 [Chloroflexota bacterium]